MTGLSKHDKQVLRELAREQQEAAADPINEVRREVSRRVEAKQFGRPRIRIYQEPWHELNQNGDLNCLCEDDFCKRIERDMRRKLYQWRTYPGDMVMDCRSDQPYCIHDTGFGIVEDVDVRSVDGASDVVSRHFNLQIKEEADIEKIQDPVVTHDEALTEELYQKRCEIFDGLLEVKKVGKESFWFAPWDFIVRLTGIQEVLTDMVLRPAYVHQLIGRLVAAWHARLDQYEALGLLAAPAQALSVSGAAQIFSEVSPAMHGEFALQHEATFLKRFGRVHYGCCEPLHNKVDICAHYLPNMYQISMSPWVDFPKAVENVGTRFVFGWRPNPAFLAYEEWNPELVRRDLTEKLALAKDAGVVLAIYLKDLSTIRYEPQRLTAWDRICKECVEDYAG